jgi:DNA-binding LacI/PurR family transcriptional regulator
VARSITIFDVAHEAGVSKSTVSNVVRGVDEVSDETRRRVLEVIERLNYKPNGIARQFVKRRTPMIGVLPSRPGCGARALPPRPHGHVLQHRG